MILLVLVLINVQLILIYTPILLLKNVFLHAHQTLMPITLQDNVLAIALNHILRILLSYNAS